MKEEGEDEVLFGSAFFEFRDGFKVGVFSSGGDASSLSGVALGADCLGQDRADDTFYTRSVVV